MREFDLVLEFISLMLVGIGYEHDGRDGLKVEEREKEKGR